MSEAGAIPVTLIGGYLGAGKTTLVNALLRNAQGRRLAVLVNEFGALAIDADLIVAQDDDLISIAGGCICCTYGSDLVEALIAMAKREPRPDQILIETSGVALPGGVAQALSLVAGLGLDAIVVVADAETVRERAQDRYLADTIARQLGEADLVVLNKADLVPPADLDETHRWIEARWPAARVVTAVRSSLAPEVVFGIATTARAASPLRLPTHVTAGYVSCAILLEQATDPDRLGRLLASAVDGLVRAKGFVTDAGGGVAGVQVVGRRSETVAATRDVLAGTRWGQIVCIGLKGVMRESDVAAAVRNARAEGA